jgi:hypothetical protein
MDDSLGTTIKQLTIQEMFKEWVDYDVAMYYLACLLGMMKYDEDWPKAIGLFNTKNEMSDMFYELLERMVKGGILEEDVDQGRGYRWNSEFTGTQYWKMTT